MNNNFVKGKFWLMVFLAMFLAFPFTDAFAYGRRSRSRQPAHQTIVIRRQRYRYHDGRFYRPTFFGFWFSFVRPPIGIVVTSLPFGHQRVVRGGQDYYCRDDVYYQRHPRGYIVVPAPDRHR